MSFEPIDFWVILAGIQTGIIAILFGQLARGEKLCAALVRRISDLESQADAPVDGSMIEEEDDKP